MCERSLLTISKTNQGSKKKTISQNQSALIRDLQSPKSLCDMPIQPNHSTVTWKNELRRS